MRPRLLQVANVGQICGGTAACAWSVTRALPRFAHHVLFLSDITPETPTAFRGCQLDQRTRLDEATIAHHRPDVILLHNTAARRCDVRYWPVPTLLYQHSQGDLVRGVERVFCSRWLAERCGGDDDHVLW